MSTFTDLLQDYTNRELITITGKARHKKIETTLRYDHVSDDMVRKYFEKQQPEPKPTDGKQNRDVGYI